MRRTVLLPVLSVVLAVAGPAWSAEETVRTDADRQIRAALKSYVAAYNRGDAEALAAFWSEEGQYTAPDGEKVTGREAIREAYEELFASNKGIRLEIRSPSIRFLGPDVAIEEGIAVLMRDGELPQRTPYAATHVKEGGSWKLKGVRELDPPVEPSLPEQLRDLAWMAGDWVDQDEDATIRTMVRLSRNGNFLTRSFAAEIGGQIDFEGIQIIGFDPSRGKIRSWLFDSDGGIGTGIWTRAGSRWKVRCTQVLPDGRTAKSTTLITYVDDNTYTMKITRRKVDGESLPDVKEVTILRKQ